VLHSFGGGSDGLQPWGGLIDVGGTLYGTTAYGGANGDGTVFSISTSGTESVLYSFGGGTDGVNPQAQLINVDGTLYGTTTKGGTSHNGTVFTITPSGTEAVLYSFAGGSDGAMPIVGLTKTRRWLYGTTINGGANGDGTAFAIIRKFGTETVLHSFGSGSDGFHPGAAPIKVGGVFYGTTENGGADNYGTVYTLSF
jgi:uncharacterized repeat protein (TIGR03803 family)